VDSLARKELCEAALAGGACVAGLSLAQVTPWLSAASLVLSCIAAALAIVTHIRRYMRKGNDDAE
jgi:purine-cytosine permease-like protein